MKLVLMVMFKSKINHTYILEECSVTDLANKDDMNDFAKSIHLVKYLGDIFYDILIDSSVKISKELYKFN